MNLKKIGIKITATFAAMLMMVGNFGLLGIELSKVIAEELEKAEEGKKEIVTFDETNPVDIYKGYLYSNVKNNTNYETEYTTVSDLNITDTNSMDNIKLAFENSEFIKIENDKEEAISSKENIYLKSTQISKFDFDTIFGVDGYIEIQSGEEVIATIKYDDAKKDRKLQVTYLNGEVKEVENDILVEYANVVNNITIKTSKPQTEGTIKIKNNKAIKATKDFNIKELESFKSVKENITVEKTKKEVIENQEVTNTVDKYSMNKELELKEPKTQIDLSVNNTNLSTLTQNDIVLTATLRTDDAKYKLFKNPIIKIELPEGIKNVSAQNVKLLYGQNTLKIEKAKMPNNRTIIIELSGEQNQYNVGALQEGASIVLPLSLTFDMATPMQDAKIKLSVNNNGEEVVSGTDVKLVSKVGLMSITNLYRSSNKSTLTVIDNEQREIVLGTGKSAEIAKMESVIVNNFDADFKNVVIIGRVSETEEINMTLKSKINIGNNAKVYYSTSKDANGADNTWVEKVSDYSKIKSYMIIIDSLKQKEKFDFNYEFMIPQKLDYNKKTNVKYDVYYNYEASKQTTTSRGERVLPSLPTQQETVAVTLRTEDVPNVSVEVKPNISLDYVHEGQVVEYIVKVKNESDQVAKNIEIENVIPNGATYAEYTTDDFDGNHTQGGYAPIKEVKTKTIAIDKLEANETKEVSIFLKVNDIDGNEESKIENSMKVNATLTTGEKKCIATASVTTPVKKSKIKVEMKYMSMSNEIREGTEVRYYLYITNDTEKELKNVKIIDEVDKDILINKDITMGNGISEINLDENNKLSFNIANINPGETTAVIIYGTIVNNSNYSTKVLRNRAIVQTKGNEDYETNPICYNAIGSDVSVSMTSNTKTNIKEKEQIEYNIVIKNQGDVARYITLSNEMSDEIFIKYLEIQYDETSKEKIEAPGKLSLSKTMEANQTIKIKMVATVNDIGDEVTSKEVSNIAVVDIKSVNGETVKTIKTDAITNVIEQSDKEDNSDNEKPVDPIDPEDPENPGEPEGPENPDEPGNPGNPEEPENPEEPDKPGNPEEPDTKYTIRGTAWLDTNKNGQREQDEALLQNIKVMVIDANTNKLATKEDGSIYSVTTAEDGTYVIDGLAKGSYILIFEYDTNKYTVTVYRKDGVDERCNSDAINKSIAINGEQKLVALTDTIEISDSGKSNIDIGLMENATFDLSLDKQISSITVTNTQGTKKTEYKNQNFAKVDLVAKYMNNTNVIITYKFIVKNEGDVIGYVDELVDNLPSGLEFSSELNKDWYKGSDGNLYTKALDGIAIKPGETSEVELVLTKKTTENTTGTFSNNAELTQISNIEAIREKEAAKANNKSSADVVISIKTGSVVMYLGITIGCIAIIGAGAYMIKKKVIDKEI